MYKRILPGILLCLAIAIPSWFLGKQFPIIGGPVFGILFGMMLAGIKRPGKLDEGITFTGKKILQYSIILLGFEMNLYNVLKVGAESLSVMIFTLAAAFGVAYVGGKLLKLDVHTTTLIGAGTAICGGSAIAAVAPVIRAKDKDVAFSISTIFLFNILAVFIFPALGHYFNFSDLGFGMWAGTAINDTSSVVAAGYSYSNAAGDYATIVKLTRALMIVPICIVLAVMTARKQVGEVDVKIADIFPWFILWFVVSSIVNTIGILPVEAANALGSLGKFCIILAMTAIGLKTHLKHLISNGIRPIVLGLLCWIAVATVSLVVQYYIGLM